MRKACVLPSAEAPISFKGYRFPPDIISYAVWLYYRFPLSLRMVDVVRSGSLEIAKRIRSTVLGHGDR